MAPRRGKFATVEYIAWNNMRFRCHSPTAQEWRNYGARGIRICSRWDDFSLFLADMGKRPSPTHSLDRIDNDGNYEPSNCRWATVAQQHANRRVPRGEENHQSKLTVADVIAMREIRRFTGASSKKIGVMFGVSQMTAYRAMVGQSWSHLPGSAS